MVLSDCISKIRITDSISFPIKEYMELYSKTIYETLINFLFKKEMGINVSDSDFHEKITPENTWKEIVQNKNTALAIVFAALIIGISLIISAAIHG